MWQYHTRTWVDNGVVHQQWRIGLGWWAVVVVGFLCISLALWMVDR